MICEVCNGHINCPVCSPEPEYILCKKCDGDGYEYYNEYGFRCLKEYFFNLPDGMGEIFMCEECNGEGKLIKEI